MTKKVFNRMKTAVVLVNLLLGQGLSNMLAFRLKGIIKITNDVENKYILQLFSSEISTHQAVDGIGVYDKSKTMTCNISTHNYETLSPPLNDSNFETSQSFTLECVDAPCGPFITTHTSSVPTKTILMSASNCSTDTTTPYTTPCTTTPASCSRDTTGQTVLGSMVGLLVVLLAVVTTGWVWTCWIMKKQGQMKINSSINTRWAKKKQP